jgi:hypothetical protein
MVRKDPTKITAHKQLLRDNAVHRRRQFADWLIAERAGGCILCGETESACLDFHHCRGTKSFQLALNAWSRSPAAIQAEREKCIVLCANCHRKVHAGLVRLSPTTTI